jgi:4-hydroxybenzoate polyprenyltransferase
MHPMAETMPSPAMIAPSPRISRASLLALAGDIKLAHSIFALPFAILGAFLANTSFGLPGNTTQFLEKLILVVACMVLARTWAMLFNRLADRKFDAANPRTVRRAMASGRVSVAAGWIAALVAAGLFILATSAFLIFFANPWPLYLSIPVLGWIALYSLTKRFTLLCHFFLGGALAASPIAACIAIEPASLGTVPSIWGIALMVIVWVAGFDVIYALQDVAFDRATGLRSIPAKLGARGSLWVSRVLHTLAILFLLAAWLVDGRLSWLFLIGIGAAAALLISEHVVLIRNDTARTGRGLDMAFFTLNGVVSCVLGTLGCLDVLF